MRRWRILLVVIIAALLAGGSVAVRLLRSDSATPEIARFALPYGDIDTTFTIQVGPSVKELQFVWFDGSGTLWLDGEFVVTAPDGQKELRGGVGFSHRRGIFNQPKPIESKRGNVTVRDGGEYRVQVKGKIGGRETELIVLGLEEAGYKPVETLDDAIRRLEVNPDDRAAQRFVRAVLWDPQLDEPSVRKLLEQLGKQPAVVCRPIYKVNAPIMIELRGGESLLKEYGRLEARVSGEWGVEIDGGKPCQMGRSRQGSVTWGTRKDLGSLIGRQAAEHLLRFYFLATWTNEGQIRTCKLLGPETQIRVVEKLPEGYLRAVTNDQLDADVRACFDLDAAGDHHRRGSSLICPLLLVKPLPISLGHDIYVSVNGSEPRLFYSYSYGGRQFPQAGSRTVAGAGQTRGMVSSMGLNIRAQPEFTKPGTYNVRFILRPSEDTALINIALREYWGGTYESPSYEFNYLSE